MNACMRHTTIEWTRNLCRSILCWTFAGCKWSAVGNLQQQQQQAQSAHLLLHIACRPNHDRTEKQIHFLSDACINILSGIHFYEMRITQFTWKLLWINYGRFASATAFTMWCVSRSLLSSATWIAVRRGSEAKPRQDNARTHITLPSKKC